VVSRLRRKLDDTGAPLIHTRTVLADASYAADLLVVGAERRHRPYGPHIGRVAHGVLHRSACPVAVVPGPE
ncbi:universal stress protein, partial [Streptomyces nigra]